MKKLILLLVLLAAGCTPPAFFSNARPPRKPRGLTTTVYNNHQISTGTTIGNNRYLMVDGHFITVKRVGD